MPVTEHRDPNHLVEENLRRLIRLVGVSLTRGATVEALDDCLVHAGLKGELPVCSSCGARGRDFHDLTCKIAPRESAEDL